MAVDGPGLAAVAVGSVFAYAGIKGISVPQALQAIVQGKSPATVPQSAPIGTPEASGGGSGGSGSTGGLGGPAPGGISASDWALVQQSAAPYGVDPYLLVAIGIHETGWGTQGDGRPPPAGHGNVLGVGSFDSGSVSTWSGLAAQLQEGAKLLNQHGVHTIADVQAGKATWWATDSTWSSQVAAVYLRIKGGG